jgi:hypothetical protein
MRSLTWCAILLGIALTVMAGAPAHAQATRTWVSGVGDDANPCSRTAPCKTFAGAISKTAPKGEINCLDPGGFGAVTITKSISIICLVEAGVLVSGTNGIIVNTLATDSVLLEGLDIEGLGTGLNGVRMIGSGRLVIRKCEIRGFTQNAVDLEGVSASPAPRVLIQDSLLTGNHGGFNVQGQGGAAMNGEVLNTVIDTNTVFGIQAIGTNNTVILAGSVVTGNPSNIIVSAGGQVISYGNNVIRNTGAPTSTLPLQ